MFHLARILYAMIATSLAGTGVIIALVTGQETLHAILIAAGIGAVAALPVTYFVTRAILAK